MPPTFAEAGVAPAATMRPMPSPMPPPLVPIPRVKPDRYRGFVSGLALGQILSWAILYYGFASLVLPMMSDLGWSKAMLMGAFTLALLSWSLASYAVGAAIDRGHERAVLAAGALLGALGCACWSVVRAPWMLYGAMLLVGVAMAMTLYEPAFNVLVKRHPQRYREGITWLTLVGGFASTLSFPAVAALVHAWGWRGALQVLAAVLLFCVMPLHAWLLRAPAQGLAPELPLTQVPRQSPRARGHPTDTAGDVAADATLQSALRTPAFWLLALAFTVLAFTGPGLWAHLMPALQARGLSEAQALTVLVCIGPAQVLGRLAYAGAGRGLSLHRLGIMVSVAMPLALLLLALSRSLAGLLLYALVFGLANGLTTIVRGSLVPAYFGRAQIGRIGGVIATLALLAQAAAPLTVATLLPLLGGYTPVLLLLAVSGVIGALAFVRARPPAAGRR